METFNRMLRATFFLALLVCGGMSTAQLPLPLSSPLDLLPPNQATHRVQTSGNWTDPLTWGGEVPTPLARVHIPAGKTLTVDREIATRIKIIRNDGKLQFATSTNTALQVETLVQSMNGELEIGTATNPIPAGTTCKLTIIDEGELDFNTDQWEKGLILMGKTVAYGAKKSSWTALTVNPTVGETTLSLKADPLGWEVGDRIVITGTDVVQAKGDEVAVIQAISGKTITLAQPLTQSHQSPAADLTVHVANLSRNIQIESESAKALDRGHIMFMHTLNVDFNYVRVHKMGRTRKDIPMDDWFIGEEDEFVNGARRNIRGRYSIHFHRGGKSPNLTPATVTGCVVEDDPGWAYANHSAFVHFHDNVSYHVIGGGFQTEAGDELGSFTHNIAIRTVNEAFPLRFEAPENAPDTRESAQDFAFQGDGFWVHGGGVSLSDNVASGCSGHGFIYWTEGLIEPGFPSGTYRNTFKYTNLGLATNPIVDTDLDEVATGWVSIKGFHNNEAYAATIGLATYYLHTTFFQDMSDYHPAYLASVHSTFDGFTGWNIDTDGIQLNFTEQITLKNIRLVNSDGDPSSHGIWASAYRIKEKQHYQDISIEGFGTGIALPPQGQVTVSCGNLSNGVNLSIPSPTLSYRDMRIEGITTRPHPAFSNPVEIRMNASFSPPEDKFPAFFLLPDKIILNYGSFQDQRLYFDEQAATYKPLPTDGEPYTFFEGSRYILSRFANKTNQQLQQDYQLSFGGSILPANATRVPGIIGGKIHPWQQESLNVPVCVDFRKETQWDVINTCITAAGANIVAGTMPTYLHPTGTCAVTSQDPSRISPASLHLYPNPTNGRFILDTQLENFDMQVFSIDGRHVWRQAGLHHQVEIDASSWKHGIYLIRITDPQTMQSSFTKLVKTDG